MSTDPVTSVTGSTSSDATAAADSATQATQTKKPDAVTAATTVSSLADFKEKAPAVYDAMTLAIATNITNEMHHRQERIKEMQREARRESGT